MDKGKENVGKIQTIVNTFHNLGFTVHPELKPSFYLTQQIEFLGFEINSVSTTITLTNAKTENLKLFCTNILNSKTPKIRTVTSLLGKLQALSQLQNLADCITETKKNSTM